VGVGGVDRKSGVAPGFFAPLVVALAAAAAVVGGMVFGGGDGRDRETVKREVLTSWMRLLAGLWAGLLAEDVDGGCPRKPMLARVPGEDDPAGSAGGGGWFLITQRRRLGDRYRLANKKARCALLARETAVTSMCFCSLIL